MQTFELALLTLNAFALPAGLWAGARWVHRVELRLARIDWQLRTLNGETMPGEVCP